MPVRLPWVRFRLTVFSSRLQSQTLAGSLQDTESQRSSRASSVKNDPDNAEEDDEDALHPAKKQKVKRDSVLHAIKWRRVVLDEGHLVKNPKAKMSRACAELKAE